MPSGRPAESLSIVHLRLLNRRRERSQDRRPGPRPGRGGGPGAPRPSLAVRWGTWVAHHRWKVLAVWGAVMIASGLVYPRLLSSLVPSDYSVTGSDSSKVSDLLSSDFSAAGAEQDVIVFNSDSLTIQDPAYRATVDRVLAKARGETGVVAVLGPTDPGAQGQVSADGHAALASLGLNGDDSQRSDRADSVQDAVASAAVSHHVVVIDGEDRTGERREQVHPRAGGPHVPLIQDCC